MNDFIEEIITTHRQIRSKIIEKLENFRYIWLTSKEIDIFKELLFCLLTPQSKAEKAWNIIEKLEKENLLFNCPMEILPNILKDVRFRFNKARYIKDAQTKFIKDGKLNLKNKIEHFDNQKEARKWLVDNVKGMGYKEASHFLRNIGKGENLTILDRHILRALKKGGIIEEIPKTLTPKKYLQIESKFEKLSEVTKIPIAHLDFVIWQIQSRRIFK